MANYVWTELERQFVREHAGKLSDQEGARQLSEIMRRKITIHAYRKQRQKMGIKKEPGRGVCEIKRSMTPEGEATEAAKRREEMGDRA